MPPTPVRGNGNQNRNYQYSKRKSLLLLINDTSTLPNEAALVLGLISFTVATAIGIALAWSVLLDIRRERHKDDR
jgi:hypothetical protein